MAEGIEDVAFGSYGGALDLLLGVAGDEEEGGAGLVGGGDGAAGDGEGFGGGCVPSDWLGSDRWRCGDEVRA